MKKILLFLILHQVTECIYSQPLFAPLGAKWYYKHEACDPNSNQFYYSTIEVTEDSIIQGKYCTLITTNICPIVSSCSQYNYVYQEGMKVFVYDDSLQGFQTLFDFSLQTGESYGIHVCNDAWDTDSVNVHIDFADTAMDGIQEITLTPVPATWWGTTEIQVKKGIGYLGDNPMLFPTNCVTFGDPCFTKRLVCYETPATGIIHLAGNPCQGPNNTDEEKANFQLSIFPNPTTDYLNFELRTTQPLQKASFRIYYANGKLVKELQSDSPKDTFIVPVWDWAAGAYFLQYEDGGEVRAVEKFMVVKR